MLSLVYTKAYFISKYSQVRSKFNSDQKSMLLQQNKERWEF